MTHTPPETADFYTGEVFSAVRITDGNLTQIHKWMRIPPECGEPFQGGFYYNDLEGEQKTASVGDWTVFNRLFGFAVYGDEAFRMLFFPYGTGGE
jgi:hypothetical protein